MKKLIAILLCLSFILVAFAACNKEEQPDDQDKDPVVDPTDSDEPTDSDTDPVDSDPDPVIPDEPVDDTPVLDLEGVEAVRYSSLGQDAAYTIGGGDKLMSFFEEPIESFLGVCKYYEDNGFELYGYNVLGSIHAATYTRGKNMYHIYWSEGENKLNLVSSKTGGELPAATPEVTTGDIKTSVTQIQSTEINGQGYVIQLADGSFIINDGGYAHRADELWDTLKTLNGSEDGIIIRAWFITHAHGDHFPCFTAFADKYGSKVTLEYLIASPLSDDQAPKGTTFYLNNGVAADVAKFSGAKLLYAHTGMVFTFCDVKVEVLFSADDLYIAEPYEGYGTTLIDFNNSSLVTRVYNDDASMLLLGDSGDTAAYRMLMYYGNYLKSDMVQISHHGVEDFPLSVYNYIKASILFYPCDQYLYDLTNRDNDVRKALAQSQYTKEILLHDKQRHTRYFADIAAAQ